jgi:hypothetical protein
MVSLRTTVFREIRRIKRRPAPGILKSCLTLLFILTYFIREAQTVINSRRIQASQDTRLPCSRTWENGHTVYIKIISLTDYHIFPGTYRLALHQPGGKLAVSCRHVMQSIISITKKPPTPLRFTTIAFFVHNGQNLHPLCGNLPFAELWKRFPASCTPLNLPIKRQTCQTLSQHTSSHIFPVCCPAIQTSHVMSSSCVYFPLDR